jgi:hypothetical protein
MLPWRPGGNTEPAWSIDKTSNMLSLSGIFIDSIAFAESYNEACFCNTMMESDVGRTALHQLWQTILGTVRKARPEVSFNAELLMALAASFSYGINDRGDPADESSLMRNLVAYLRLVLDDETFKTYIPSEISNKAGDADGRVFGKPVWDFKYPESSVFVTKGGFIGCSVSVTKPGDVVCAALGSTYPTILRPEVDVFVVQGYAYVHGVMRGERRESRENVFRIR